MGAGEDANDEIIGLIREESEGREAISPELLLEIYELEEELSTLDRRHGIKDRLQEILEDYVDEEDAA